MAGTEVYRLGDYEAAVKRALAEWQRDGRVERLWQGDSALWSGGDEGRWVGWLRIVEQMQRASGDLKQAAEAVRTAGIEHLLLLGMGGSSLCPEVLSMTFGRVPGYPRLHVLDSTVPAQVRRFAAQVDLRKTLCLVASKSGTTTEPNAFCDYFWAEMNGAVGREAGRRFAAITDPGSALEDRARRDGFRYVFTGVPDIGGRFSALSNFGMAPAAMMGVDVDAFLARAAAMAARCAPGTPVEENPGVALGVILGTLAQAGRDKVTLVASPQIWDLGAWLEQLLAESTGKQGKGLAPVDNEPLTPPDAYGDDRLFVYIRLETGADAEQDAAVGALEAAGHPVVRIEIADAMDLGAEFFRWEIATAAAGSVLKINPFDQPNVQESKDFTSALTKAYAASGSLPSQTALFSEDGITVFAEGENAAALAGADSLEACLAAHLARIRPGDYAAVCAYVDMTERHQDRLQALRLSIRDRKGVATTLGYGPRFLHSTGQLHKGGADNGVFLQMTSDDAEDLPIAGKAFSFGVLKAAQALGDFQALNARGRRVVRLHLPADVEAGLDRLLQATQSAASDGS